MTWMENIEAAVGDHNLFTEAMGTSNETFEVFLADDPSMGRFRPFKPLSDFIDGDGLSS